MRIIAAAGVVLVFNVNMYAQTGWDYLTGTPEPIIGLLDLPDVVQHGCGPAPKRATARVFRQPSETSALGTIYWHEVPDKECDLMIERTGTREKVPTLESGYEIPAAIVFERRGSWFRIRLPQGSGWIRRSDTADYQAYPEVVRDSLPNLLEGWDGTLRVSPSQTAAVTPLSSGWRKLLDRSISVEYLDSRRVGGALWLHIRLAAKAACDHVYEGVTDVSGWIPAYRANHTPNVWFSSRGC
jgi:hypothetical protein